MPYKRPGTWEGKPNYRWVKMVRGQRLRIRCADELHLPMSQWTEVGSIKAANEWLEKKLAEMNLADPPKPIETVRNAINGMNADDLARLADQGQMAARLLNMIGKIGSEGNVQTLPDGSTTVPLDMTQIGLDRLRQGEVDSALLAELLSGREGRKPMREEWARNMADDFASRLAGKSKVETTGNLEQAGKDFLAIIVGKLRPASYREIMDVINKLPEFADAHGRIIPADVAEINEETVKRMYFYFETATFSQGKKKKNFGIFQRFVANLAEENILELPRNLHSPHYKFKCSPKAIKTFANDVVRAAIDALPSRLQLYAMLSLNCSMNNCDIGQLEKSQIKNGYLTRKRVKTSENVNVPTVSYRLWPRTLELLAEHKSKHETLMLTSADNTPLWAARIENGEAKQKDLICQQWQKYKTNHKGKCGIQLKQFRSIGASQLENHAEYGRYGSLYLGHSPRTIKDRHYAAVSQTIFDQAILWLGEQFGF